MNNNETQFQIGRLLHEPAERDAIHIAVLPVVAAEDLRPGERIGFTEEGNAEQVGRAGREIAAVGIVDPFLPQGIYQGERFWMFLNPNTITGMRHHWQHPTIDTPGATAQPRATRVESAAWLREFAARWRLDYDQMIETATEGDEYITVRDREVHGAEDLGEDHELFWWHLEGLTGRRFSREHRDSVGWSCTC